MTWLSFRNEVRAVLTVDADRMGVEALIDKQTRAAVLDLLEKVPRYRSGFSTVVQPEDLIAEGSVSQGALPSGAWMKEAFILRSKDHPALPTGADVVRHPCLDDIAWEHRFLLINGLVAVNDDNGRLCIAPNGVDFYVYPRLPDDGEPDAEGRYHCLQLFYDTDALAFGDNDATPFDERMVLCVADYVKGEIARHVEKNEGMYDSFMKSFALKRRKLYVRGQQLGRLNG